MSSSGGALSETLQSITTTKLKELSKKRATFEEQKASLLLEVQLETDLKDRARKLVEGVKKCFSVSLDSVSRGFAAHRVDNRLYTKLYNYERFLQQARYDPSLSANLLQDWERPLLQQLNVQTPKYQYATLYGELVMEWLAAERSATVLPDDVSEESESFESTARKEKIEHRMQWEKTVF
jgi:hypothetical protein